MRLEKKQRRLLARAAPLLRRVMEPDEKVLYLTFGSSPFTLLELLTFQGLIFSAKRCLLVATDQRLLQIPVKAFLRPQRSIAQIRYGDVLELVVRRGLIPRLVVRYANWEREILRNLPRRGSKKLKALLPEHVGCGRASVVGGRHFLCPSCASPLCRSEASCSVCGLAFKVRRRAVAYSILFPGGGYFYTRHPLLGLGDAFVETLLLVWLGFAVLLAVASSWEPAVVAGLIFCAAVLLVEKLVTIYHASHFVDEQIPAGGGFWRRRQLAAT